MGQYYRKRDVILGSDKKTVTFTGKDAAGYPSINAAKRESLKLQKAGHKVTRLANKKGLKY